MHSEYQSATRIKSHFGVSSSSLRRWAQASQIRCLRFGGAGKRLYHFHDIQKYLGAESKSSDHGQKTQKIIYCRVSSAHQKEDLQRQIQDLSGHYPQHIIISDIASGLNFKRKGLQTLLDKTFEGLVQEVVVLHKDRLCRYGIEILEYIFQKSGTRFLVHGQETQEPKDDTQELAEDLLAITNVFVARHNGRRSATNRRMRRKESGIQSNQDTLIPNQKTTSDSL